MEHLPESRYDIIVVGGGHAGVEAALAAARMGKSTLLLTMNISTIAQMSCNPAMGGLAKGHLIRELDALGGEIGRATDLNGIQFKMLNRSKGPAVWSPRAQVDKYRYSQYMIHTLFNTPLLDVRQYMVTSVLVSEGAVSGVKTHTGRVFYSRAVILAGGTFLNGKIFTGLFSMDSGRLGEAPATGLASSLLELGFVSGRLKTGTPPRVRKDSIDFSRCEIQPGETPPLPFRFFENLINLPQVPCYLTATNERTHEIISQGLDRSPIYTGIIESVGPRYCPSVEDKVVRFSDKPSHQIFLEPEGLDSPEFYVNGFSTSLPEDIQERAIRTIPGLEHVKITRLGYAIEYDFFPPHQILHTLETKLVENLYFAGQINGTSGYEEAAAQGFLAAVNAVRKLDAQKPLILGRHEAYMGVLVDDLITKGTEEPYRMFTSRAEFRLLLRQDNAHERLMPLGRELGLVDDRRWEIFQQRHTTLKKAERLLHNHRPRQNQTNSTETNGGDATWYQLLRRPENTLPKMLPLLEESVPFWRDLELDVELLQQLQTRIKYEGYIQRQVRQVQSLNEQENKLIPESFAYDSISSISNEAREKLKKIRPRSLGQAARISGVSPADIAVLLIHLKRRSQKAEMFHVEQPNDEADPRNDRK